VGDDQDRARIVAQMALEPVHRPGVEMIGRLVEQQQLRLVEQQPTERHAPPLAAGQLGHVGVVGRASQRVHRLVYLGVEVPQPLGLDLVLQIGHLVGVLVRVIGGELVVAVEDRLLRGDPLHHVLAHALGGIELRLLLEVADTGALGDPGLPGELGVDARHDPQQGRFAGTIDAEHADLGVRIERQVDVLQDLPVARIGLRETLHVIDELTGHEPPCPHCWAPVGADWWEFGADVARRVRKSKLAARPGSPMSHGQKRKHENV
jgi:hypothetical protein